MNTVGRPELYSVLYSSNQSANTNGAITVSNSALVPTVSAPGVSTTDGIVTCLGPDGFSGISSLKIVPFGVGTSTKTFLMAVYGWTPTTGNVTNPSSVKQPLWIPTVLAYLTCTLGGSMPGVAGCDVDANQLFCSTIAITTGNANYTTEVIVSSTQGLSHAVVAVKDAHYVQIILDIGSAQATSCNALIQRM